MTRKGRRRGMKTRKKKSATDTRFRPGTTGECEAQLWTFIGSPEILPDGERSPGALGRRGIPGCGFALYAPVARRFHHHRGAISRYDPAALGISAGLINPMDGSSRSPGLKETKSPRR
jgi:hypothetical protein